MLTPYLEASVQVVDRDYESMVEVVSSILVNARGDAGKIMLDAYRAVSAEEDPNVRGVKMEFVERVRVAYVSTPVLKG
ncbi:hypothetical protein Q6P37_005138 [Salmonella enterica]|nr:hypothetical protein [Salmonella enterica]ELQ0070763.1 hypothetical protein [Salmonella enterica]